jgi:hypothetical protein
LAGLGRWLSRSDLVLWHKAAEAKAASLRQLLED